MDLTVVSERSEVDVERRRAAQEIERAEDQIEGALRELVANILRIMRGAGKGYEVGNHLGRAYEAMLEYERLTGHGMWKASVPHRLSIRQSLDTSAADYFVTHEEEDMISGAMQIVASRLLGQRTQESAGDREMHIASNDRCDALKRFQRRA